MDLTDRASANGCSSPSDEEAALTTGLTIHPLIFYSGRNPVEVGGGFYTAKITKGFGGHRAVDAGG